MEIRGDIYSPRACADVTDACLLFCSKHVCGPCLAVCPLFCLSMEIFEKKPWHLGFAS